MLTVSDIMCRNVLTLEVGATVGEATKALLDRGVSGAPVLDRGRPVGVVTKTDLLRAKTTGAAVAEVMTPGVHVVRPEDAAQAAVDRMLDLRIHRVVVIDQEGNLAGIVTPADVLRAERSYALNYPSVWAMNWAARTPPDEGGY